MGRQYNASHNQDGLTSTDVKAFMEDCYAPAVPFPPSVLGHLTLNYSGMQPDHRSIRQEQPWSHPPALMSSSEDICRPSWAEFHFLAPAASDCSSALPLDYESTYASWDTLINTCTPAKLSPAPPFGGLYPISGTLPDMHQTDVSNDTICKSWFDIAAESDDALIVLPSKVAPKYPRRKCKARKPATLPRPSGTKDQSWSHFTPPKHKCSNCSSRYSRPEHLKRHIETTHDRPKSHRCKVPQCAKLLSRPDNLRAHYWTHVYRGGSAGRNIRFTLQELSKILLPGEEHTMGLLQLRLQKYKNGGGRRFQRRN